jgi:hypothetical protein
LFVVCEHQNYEESYWLAGAGGSSTVLPLGEYISDGSVLYTKGGLFFSRYYSVAFAMLRWSEHCLTRVVKPD